MRKIVLAVALTLSVSGCVMTGSEDMNASAPIADRPGIGGCGEVACSKGGGSAF